ncbi:MAG: YceI family protein [Acidimicrobiales bacterium]|nr:YceI family protein [Acidimicrobiales bacterium]
MSESSLPPAGKWTIDTVHSGVNFSVRHMVAAKVRGRFNSFSGTLDIADPIENSTVEVNIEAASFDTGTSQRDDHVKSADFLDVENYPTITFKTDSLKLEGDNEGKLGGSLTLRGKSVPVELQVEFLGTEKHPDGSIRAGFSAIAELDRDDFGVSWNAVLETGGLMVGKKVKVEIDIEAVKE